MPEAAVHADQSFMTRQHDVGGSWEIPPVQAEAVAHRVQGLPCPHFRTGVLALDPGHLGAALGRREAIEHG